MTGHIIHNYLILANKLLHFKLEIEHVKILQKFSQLSKCQYVVSAEKCKIQWNLFHWLIELSASLLFRFHKNLHCLWESKKIIILLIHQQYFLVLGIKSMKIKSNICALEHPTIPYSYHLIHKHSLYYLKLRLCMRPLRSC